MLTVVACADLHGKLPTPPKCDLLIIAGDIFPVYNHLDQFQLSWFKDKFIPWINKIQFLHDFSRVILVAGNHDFVFQSLLATKKSREFIKEDTNGRLIYLQDEMYNFKYKSEDNKDKVYKIYGTPWCHIFGKWAFMLNEEGLIDKFRHIPKDIDILVTHDVPFGTSDYVNVQGEMVNKGNKPLADVILERQPIINFCGHLHDDANELESYLGFTQINNVASVGEDYVLKDHPFTIFNN